MVEDFVSGVIYAPPDWLSRGVALLDFPCPFPSSEGVVHPRIVVLFPFALAEPEGEGGAALQSILDYTKRNFGFFVCTCPTLRRA